MGLRLKQREPQNDETKFFSAFVGRIAHLHVDVPTDVADRHEMRGWQERRAFVVGSSFAAKEDWRLVGIVSAFGMKGSEWVRCVYVSFHDLETGPCFHLPHVCNRPLADQAKVARSFR